MGSIIRSLALFLAFAGPTVGCTGAVQAAPSSETTAIRTIDVDALERARADGSAQVLIDVRTPAEYADGHVPGAKNIPLDQIGSRMAELPTDQEIYLVCRSGSRSARAASLLSAEGRQTVNVAGGTLAWQRAGKAVE
jgi:rhodanese-related sulfurtransferase